MSDTHLGMGGSERKFAFIVPTLGDTAAQDEDTVQLMVFAAVWLEQELIEHPDRTVTAMILTVAPQTSGWKDLAGLFSQQALTHVTIEELTEPSTPTLTIPCHKAAYDVFEFLKTHAFDEVHGLDRHGLLYYPTQGKRLGLYFLETAFAVHVVGGTIFRTECEDALLDDVSGLAEDLLERGSLERADAIYVHDTRAWRWYAGKINPHSAVRIYDVAWPDAKAEAAASSAGPAGTIPAIVFYGTLGADGGLPLFCDAIDRALPRLDGPVEIVCVGSPRPIGGSDAVSYIRLRSGKWRVPVRIERGLSVVEEVVRIAAQAAVVVCDTVRREGLRPRLIIDADLPVLHITRLSGDEHPRIDGPYPATPERVAGKLVEMLTTTRRHDAQPPPHVTELWRRHRPRLPDLGDLEPAQPLETETDAPPKVSVVVTHFSRPQKLRTALRSLKQQTYRNFEVIVVDDGSPDPQVQAELQRIKEEIHAFGWRLVTQENRYLGAARNFGASYATGDYLLFMDDDNVAKPHELSTFVAVARRAQAGIVTAFCDGFGTDAELEHTTPPMRFTPFGADPILGIFTNCYGDANALYARSVFDKLGGFTEDYGVTHEDWELFCRASLEGVAMVCVPEPLFWYRVDSAGMFLGERTRLHKSANLRRHIRPFLAKLPYPQAKLVLLAQGLTAGLPITTCGNATRRVVPQRLHDQRRLPYARVAIIMRTKDRPLLLRRAVHSVLDQTFQDWLLVVVNDGGRVEAVERILDEVDTELAGRALVVHHPVSLGMQTASNAGIVSCDSDFIVIHDDDDSWSPTFLSRTVDHLDEHGWNARIGGVITWSWLIVEALDDAGLWEQRSRAIYDDTLRTVSLVDLAIENRFPPISFLFRRAALDAVGPFREEHTVLGDWDFHLRVLERFDIGVIPEPLANYHHRAQTTSGAYGNSVHTQTDLHRSARIALINDAVRDAMSHPNQWSRSHLLASAELHRTAMSGHAKSFDLLRSEIGRLERRLDHLTAMNPKRRTRSPRTLAWNGDFREWPGLGTVVMGPGEQYAFMQICPGFLITYDGLQASYRIERRIWTQDGKALPVGKTYLHIENDGHTKNATSFMLECRIPSVLALAGSEIVISGVSRLTGSWNSILIGGRYHLGDGREMRWPDVPVCIGPECERWVCCIACPRVEKSEIASGHESRILFKLPHNRPFEFDLTNVQVEMGLIPTEFEFRSSPGPVRQRLAHLGRAAGLIFSKMRRIRTAAP